MVTGDENKLVISHILSCALRSIFCVPNPNPNPNRYLAKCTVAEEFTLHVHKESYTLVRKMKRSLKLRFNRKQQLNRGLFVVVRECYCVLLVCCVLESSFVVPHLCLGAPQLKTAHCVVPSLYRFGVQGIGEWVRGDISALD